MLLPSTLGKAGAWKTCTAQSGLIDFRHLKKMKMAKIRPHKFHGEWNYSINPLYSSNCTSYLLTIPYDVIENLSHIPKFAETY